MLLLHLFIVRCLGLFDCTVQSSYKLPMWVIKESRRVFDNFISIGSRVSSIINKPEYCFGLPVSAKHIIFLQSLFIRLRTLFLDIVSNIVTMHSHSTRIDLICEIYVLNSQTPAERRVRSANKFGLQAAVVTLVDHTL